MIIQMVGLTFVIVYLLQCWYRAQAASLVIEITSISIEWVRAAGNDRHLHVVYNLYPNQKC